VPQGGGAVNNLLSINSLKLTATAVTNDQLSQTGFSPQRT
jgi:hypothetical protein